MRTGGWVRLLVAVAIGVSLLTACGNDDGRLSSSSSTTAAGPADELLFFNPTHLPPNKVVSSVSMQQRGNDDPIWTMRLGRPTGDGMFDDIVAIIATRPKTLREISESERKSSNEVDINDHVALTQDSPLVGATLAWMQDGCEVSLLAPPGDGPTLPDLARHLNVSCDPIEETRLVGTPSGMDVITQTSASTYPTRNYTMELRGESGDPTGEMSINVALVPSDAPAAAYGVGHSAKRRSIRGHDGWVFTTTNDIGGVPFVQLLVAWMEQPGLLVVLQGSASETETLAVAEGLQAESEQQWRGRYEVREL